MTQESHTREFLHQRVASLEAALEERAQQAEARLHSLLGITRTVILVLSPELKLLEFNRAAEALYGCSREHALCADYLEAFVPVEYHAPIREVVRHALDGLPTESFEHPVRCKDGVELTLLWNLTCVRDAGGEPTGVLACGVDITARRQMELALQRSEERFRQLAEHIEEVFWIVTPDWSEFLYMSPAYAKTFGRTRETLYSKPSAWLDAVLEEDRPRVRAEIEEKVQRGFSDPEFSEYRIARPDGTVCWIHARAFPIPNDQGEIYRVAGIARDITARKLAEQEKDLLEERMRETQKLESLGVMAGGIAHEFNNLLMAILGNADLAASELEAGSGVEPFVAAIVKASRQAAKLTRQMLAYSGRGRLQVEDLDLNALARDMEGLLEVSLPKKVEIELELSPGLPGVRGDVSQLRQVLVSLVTNAAEAMDEEGGRVRVVTRERSCDRECLDAEYMTSELPVGSYVILEISDTGCGMDEDTQRRIFDPFYTSKFTGRGLGLAAVQGIVRGHKGAIRVRSAPGSGSTLTVYLPALVAAVPERPQPEVACKEWRGEGLVLVVDDEEVVRHVAQVMLQRMGFGVLLAKDGVEGVEVFKQHHDEIVCVLLDLKMPRMDGDESFRAMRKIQDDVVAVLCSGYPEEECAERLGGEGLAGFLQKPYESDTLRAMLRWVVTNR